MLKINSDAELTATQILESEFFQHFLLEESLRGKRGEYALEQAMGKPFERYEQEYEEKRLLGKGGMGKVMLVKQKETHEFFAAKQQLDSKHFDAAREELLLLQKLKHPNIVNCVDSFHTPGQEKCVIILEFCPCKFSLFSSFKCLIDGDLSGQSKFWKG